MKCFTRILIRTNYDDYVVINSITSNYSPTKTQVETLPYPILYF